MPNGYQLRKAKTILTFLLSCKTSLTRHQTAQAIALMSFDEWRTLAFSAGVPLADIEAKAAVLAMLRGRTIHAV